MTRTPRTPDVLAKVLRILFCKSCNSAENYLSARIEKTEMKSLAGLKKFSGDYINDLRLAMQENYMNLYVFKECFVVVDMYQLLGYSPKIQQDLLHKVAPSDQEIEFNDKAGCNWQVDHPVWENKD